MDNFRGAHGLYCRFYRFQHQLFKELYAMPYDELMANRVREALAEHTDALDEKAMFGGLCFMVNDKMCICINKEGLLCRIGADVVEQAVEENGVSIMMNGSRQMKDFVYVDGDVVRGKKELDYWIARALAFNKTAKVAKKQKR